MIADRSSPLHLVGVGNELRADDAVGLVIVSQLRAKLGGAPAPGLKIHPGCQEPERLLAKLASGEGRIVVFDAVEASGEPGDVVVRSMADTKYGFFGTHNIPLKLVPGIDGRLDDVFLVGVQPESLDVRHGLSETVRAAARQIVSAVAEGAEERA